MKKGDRLDQTSEYCMQSHSKCDSEAASAAESNYYKVGLSSFSIPSYPLLQNYFII